VKADDPNEAKAGLASSRLATVADKHRLLATYFINQPTNNNHHNQQQTHSPNHIIDGS
jgi:hypothetical protein